MYPGGSSASGAGPPCSRPCSDLPFSDGNGPAVDEDEDAGGGGGGGAGGGAEGAGGVFGGTGGAVIGGRCTELDSSVAEVVVPVCNESP